ncbi:hypothetical protein D3C76_242790 [compost metagenome]
MMVVNKGTSIGWSLEALKLDKDVLGLRLVSVLGCILHPIQGDVHKLRPQYQGLIEEARVALVHDIHGLAVLNDMLQYIFDKPSGLQHKDFLYVMEIVEKYFTNMRSIYDFMSKVLRLAVEERDIGKVSFDSLNSLIAFAETNAKAEQFLPEVLISLLTNIKAEFDLVRNIRDFIIHNGKQISLLKDDKGYLIGPFNDEGALIELLPGENNKYEYLIPFLSQRTELMLKFGESIAEVIHVEFVRMHGEFPFMWCALEGVCIPSFVKLLKW